MQVVVIGSSKKELSKQLRSLDSSNRSFSFKFQSTCQVFCFLFIYGVLIIKINGSYAQRENYQKKRYFSVDCNTFLKKMDALNAAKRDVTFIYLIKFFNRYTVRVYCKRKRSCTVPRIHPQTEKRVEPGNYYFGSIISHRYSIYAIIIWPVEAQMSLFVHERPTLTLIDFLVQIVSESISNRVDYKFFLGDAPRSS